MSEIAFEDIVKYDDHTVQCMMRDLEPNVLAVALKGASADLQARFFENMGNRGAMILKEEIELSTASAREIEKARQQVMDVLRSLDAP